MSQSYGYLEVRTFEAKEALPVPGVKVTVYKKNNGKPENIGTYMTNEDGKTQLIKLETREKDLSLAPSDIKPYVGYDVKTELPGYYTKYFVDLPIFPGSTSLQKVPMVPSPADGNGNEIQYIIEKEPEDL